jgi:hypothetical protein
MCHDIVVWVGGGGAVKQLYWHCHAVCDYILCVRACLLVQKNVPHMQYYYIGVCTCTCGMPHVCNFFNCCVCMCVGKMPLMQVLPRTRYMCVYACMCVYIGITLALNEIYLIYFYIGS